MEESTKKPLIRPFEMMMLIIGIGVVGYIFLKKQGVVFMEKTEQVDIVDKPTDYSNRRKTVSYDKEQNMTDLEEILQELTGISGSNTAVSKSDVDFYKKVKENYQSSSKSESISWMKYLSSSYSVYNKLRSMVSNDDRSQMEIMADDFKKMVDNPEMTSKLVDGIKVMYNISANDTKSFLSSEENLDAAKLVEFVKRKSVENEK